MPRYFFNVRHRPGPEGLAEDHEGDELADVNAAVLIQVAVGWSAEARRSSKLPGVLRSTPETMLGRCEPPNRPVLSACTTAIGNPL